MSAFDMSEVERDNMVAEGGHEFDPPQSQSQDVDNWGAVRSEDLDFELDNPFDDSDDSDVVEMDDAGDDQIFIIVEAPKNRRVHVTIDPALAF